MSAGATFGKAIGAICLCLIGVVGLIYAWTLLVFSGDASPGYETATKIKAIVIARGSWMPNDINIIWKLCLTELWNILFSYSSL